MTERNFTKEGVYDSRGRLIKPLEGFVFYQPHLYPVKDDGIVPYRLMAQNAVAGTSHADRLGFILTYWQYDGHTKYWCLYPEYFWLMLG